jgi:hypothetical protein
VLIYNHSKGKRPKKRRIKMKKAEQIKWLQEIECRLYYELEKETDFKKQNKYERVKSLLEKIGR